MCAYYDYIIPGLDILIGDPSILDPSKDEEMKAGLFYIPEGYIRVIEEFHNEQSIRGDACRELARRFKEISFALRDSGDGFLLKNGTMVFFVNQECLEPEPGLTLNSSKHQAILAVKYFCSLLESEVGRIAIMTNNDVLATMAALHEIEVTSINPKIYTGRRKVKLPMEATSLWFSGKKITAKDWEEYFPDEEPLRANEFVEFIYDDFGQVDHTFGNIGRFVQEEDALMPLRYFRFNHPTFNKIYPKTAGQAMLLEALMAPPDEIPLVIVSGAFGTGKTFLSVAAGYFGVSEDGIYERVFVCPRDGALGERIGFVPGDSTEKTLVKSKPILDNLRSILRLTNPRKKSSKYGDDFADNLPAKRDCIDKRVDEILENYFEFEPVIYMGGRSIENSFIIYDEFQDMERYQAKSLLSRIGCNSKVVASGDPTQLTNPHLSYASNGLSYSVSRLAGCPKAAIITLEMDEIVRSNAAIAIAECF